MNDPYFDFLFFEKLIQLGCKSCRSCVQLFLERWPLLLQVLEDGACGGHGQRMMTKSTSHEGLAMIEDRMGIVSILPFAPAIDPVHEFGLPGHDADRHSTTGDLAIGDKVGFYAEPFL